MQCSVCHESCKKCNGTALNNCLDCYTGYFLDGSICSKCDAACSSCKSSLATECLTCQPKFHFYEGQCLTSCPTAFFSNNWICEKCSEGCQTCYNSSDDTCYTCTADFCFKSPSSCLKSNLYYRNSIDGTCALCNQACDGCTGSSSS